MKNPYSKPYIFVLKKELLEDDQGYLISPDQSEPAKTCALSDCAQVINGDVKNNLIIAMPGSQVLQLFVDAPKVSGSKLDKALYWSVEPFLSTDIDDNEIRWCKAPSQERPNRTLITAVSNTLLERWEKHLSEIGLSTAKLTLLGQFLLSPDPETNVCTHWEEWTLWESTEGAGCFERDVFSLAAATEISNVRSDFTTYAEDADKVTALNEAIAGAASTKLISFNHHHSEKNQWLEYVAWKPLVAASVACLICVATYFLVMGNRFEQQSEQYLGVSRAQYQAWFPNDQRIFDVQRQLQGKLRQGLTSNTGEGFVSMIETMAQNIENRVDNYQFQRLRFRGENSTLEIVSIFDSMDVVKSLETDLENSNLNMTVQSATRKSAGIEVGFTVANENLAR